MCGFSYLVEMTCYFRVYHTFNSLHLIRSTRDFIDRKERVPGGARCTDRDDDILGTERVFRQIHMYYADVAGSKYLLRVDVPANLKAAGQPSGKDDEGVG